MNVVCLFSSVRRNAFHCQRAEARHDHFVHPREYGSFAHILTEHVRVQ